VLLAIRELTVLETVYHSTFSIWHSKLNSDSLAPFSRDNGREWSRCKILSVGNKHRKADKEKSHMKDARITFCAIVYVATAAPNTSAIATTADLKYR
jgi:hypothetical protein